MNKYAFKCSPSKHLEYCKQTTSFRFYYTLKCYTIPSIMKEEQDLLAVHPTPQHHKAKIQRRKTTSGRQFAYSWSSSAITPDVNPNSSGEAASITEVGQ